MAQRMPPMLPHYGAESQKSTSVDSWPCGRQVQRHSTSESFKRLNSTSWMARVLHVCVWGCQHAYGQRHHVCLEDCHYNGTSKAGYNSKVRLLRINIRGKPTVPAGSSTHGKGLPRQKAVPNLHRHGETRPRSGQGWSTHALQASGRVTRRPAPSIRREARHIVFAS